MANKIEEYNKLKTEIESSIAEGLKKMFQKIVPQSEIFVSLNPEQENVTIQVLMRSEISITTMSITENIFIYNFNDPENLIFQGVNRISVYKPHEKSIDQYSNSTLYSLAASPAEIDLRTLTSLRSRIKEFFTDQGLVNNPITIEEEEEITNSLNAQIKELVIET